jgi:hypothetical protein
MDLPVPVTNTILGIPCQSAIKRQSGGETGSRALQGNEVGGRLRMLRFWVQVVRA